MSVVNLLTYNRPGPRLLTGTLVCGGCGTPMDRGLGRGRSRSSYRCPAAVGCGRARIVEPELDDVVYAAIVGALKSAKRASIAETMKGHDGEVSTDVVRFRRQWEAQGLEWKRALVRRLLKEIVVHPDAGAVPVRGRPGRVELVWRR